MVNKVYRSIVKFYNRNIKHMEADAQEWEEDEEEQEMPPFTRWVSFGAHLYRQAGERCDVKFVDKDRGVRRTIVNNAGWIVRFPGVKRGEWTQYLKSEKSLLPIVRYRTEFEEYDDAHYIMIWEVQPDGMYWEDSDGFGGSSDLEICLYTLIDHRGRFDGPFRLYSVGDKIEVPPVDS